MQLEANNLEDLLLKVPGSILQPNFEKYVSSQFLNILVLEKPVNNPNQGTGMQLCIDRSSWKRTGLCESEKKSMYLMYLT
jgi:hypothetical protein